MSYPPDIDPNDMPAIESNRSQCLSPITNEFEDSIARGRRKLSIERVAVHRPDPDWSYAHHPHLTVFKGKLYATWSNGRKDEDAPDQRVLLSHSENFYDWEKPIVLFQSEPASNCGIHIGGVMTAGGFHSHENDLVAYAGYFEYAEDLLVNGMRPISDTGHTNTKLLVRGSRDGENWLPMQDLGLPFVPNHGPQRTASGRLLMSGGISFPYTDDPSGLSGWTSTGIVPGNNIIDDSGFFESAKKKMGWDGMPCEGSFYQTDDGRLHMLLRTGTGRLWVTESDDDGESWSCPMRTSFTDNSTKFHFGRLPDGRFYQIGNPDPKPEFHRNPLVLSLSRDGFRFDQAFILADEPYQARYEGMHKVGHYGYPHSIIHGEHLYVIFSRMKEAIELLRIPLKAIS